MQARTRFWSTFTNLSVREKPIEFSIKPICNVIRKRFSSNPSRSSRLVSLQAPRLRRSQATQRRQQSLCCSYYLEDLLAPPLSVGGNFGNADFRAKSRSRMISV